MTAGTATALLPFAIAIGIWVSWSDMKFMKIPNNAVIALLLVWLLIAPLTILLAGLPVMEWLWGWALAAIVLAVGFVSNAARLIGAGDAKFAAAMAPFFVGADLRIVMALFAACLLGAFTDLPPQIGQVGHTKIFLWVWPYPGHWFSIFCSQLKAHSRA